jgi:peptide/nickel transport system permease protein
MTQVAQTYTPDSKLRQIATSFGQGWRVFRKNKVAVFCLGLIIAIVAFCFLGPYFYHSNQNDIGALMGQSCNQPPSSQHPLGTDHTCFDMVGRLMVGGQSSFTVGLLAAIIAIVFGCTYGVIAGYRGGRTDSIMMRLLDVLLSIPGLYLVLDLVALFGRNRTMMIAIIGLTGWYGVARLIRSESLTLREREYVQAVRVMGGGTRRIMTKHILPNSISTITTLATFSVGDGILSLAGLGYLGLGLVTPQTDWGTMLNTSFTAILLNYWWQIWPVVILFLAVVMSFNYLGSALRDALEVRLRER